MQRLLLALVLTIGPQAGAGAAIDPYDHFGANREMIARGVQALLTCNGLFTSERTLEQVAGHREQFEASEAEPQEVEHASAGHDEECSNVQKQPEHKVQPPQRLQAGIWLRHGWHRPMPRRDADGVGETPPAVGSLTRNAQRSCSSTNPASAAIRSA